MRIFGRVYREIESRSPKLDAAVYDALLKLRWNGQTMFEAAEGAITREALRRHGTQRAAGLAVGVSGRVFNYRMRVWGYQDKQQAAQ